MSDTGVTVTKEQGALAIVAGVLEAVRPYCLLELTARHTVTHRGERLGAVTIDEALDLADEVLAGLDRNLSIGGEAQS